MTTPSPSREIDSPKPESEVRNTPVAHIRSEVSHPAQEPLDNVENVNSVSQPGSHESEVQIHQTEQLPSEEQDPADADIGSSQNPTPRKFSVSFWNAVVRGPMRRLQERILGFRSNSGAEASRSSIWLLGVCYVLADDDTSTDVTTTEAYAAFLSDFTSRIWITYRKGFEAIEPGNLTSDVGWGCMIRSGQMLLAQALSCHYLGRHWRRRQTEPNDKEYLRILQSFGDSASKDCVFSIHKILEAGVRYGLAAGSWLGPYALCRSIEELASSHWREKGIAENESKLPFQVYVVSGDGNGERGGAPCICIDDIVTLCSGSSENLWIPVLLLVPLVLGLDKVNSRYLPSLWATFTFPQSLGVLGGKPGASTYIIGVQDDQAIYLDPHDVQQAILVLPDNANIDTSSYHCSIVKKVPLSAIDPSLALGFYCRERADFEDLCKRASELAEESNGAPMFTVVNSCERVSQTLENNESTGPCPEDAPSEGDWQIL